jgi:hypothetical protein
VFDTAHAVALQEGLSFGGKEELERVIDQMEASLLKEMNNPTLLYGRRAEALFGYVASALGQPILVKQEDAGDTISSDPNIQPPDYRILLPGPSEFFVEVKNVHRKDPRSRFPFKDSYIHSLEAYANAFGHPLKFAIYWSAWHTWTLISVDKLPLNKGKRSINMIEAIKMNELAVLADFMIGTRPPITMRLVADPAKPSSIIDEVAQFTIGATEFYCAGERILDPAECKIAIYMMMYGKWSEITEDYKIEEGRVIWNDVSVSPDVWEPQQGFAFVGSLSGMISRQFEFMTAPSGKIERMRPSAEPESFGVAIPHEYKSSNLHLWRMKQQPSYT